MSSFGRSIRTTALRARSIRTSPTHQLTEHRYAPPACDAPLMRCHMSFFFAGMHRCFHADLQDTDGRHGRGLAMGDLKQSIKRVGVSGRWLALSPNLDLERRISRCWLLERRRACPGVGCKAGVATVVVVLSLCTARAPVASCAELPE